MIDLYSWLTPNGLKLHIVVEELGIPYNLHPVNITRGEQFEPDFLKISPNNKIPALVDSDGPDGKPYASFETGAMMIYLAEKTGKLMPTDVAGRNDTIQWLMFQMGGVGPMFGQFAHFTDYAPDKIDYAVDRYTNECMRLYGVVDRRLAEAEYLAGDDYTIADIASYSWMHSYERRGFDLTGLDNVLRWLNAIGERPAVIKGKTMLADLKRSGKPDKETLENYFGKTQFER
jgi:GSH-dependent disulfide-bond oxidoreductase